VYTMDHVRRREPAELTTVVEAFRERESEAAPLTRRILEEGGIRLQPLSQVDDYARSIRRELAIE
jgi:hypothetical protein